MTRTNMCEENDFRYTPLATMDDIFGPAVVYDLAADTNVSAAGTPKLAGVIYNDELDLFNLTHQNHIINQIIEMSPDYLFINPPYSRQAGGIGKFWHTAINIADVTDRVLVMLTNSRSSSSGWYHAALVQSTFSANLSTRINFDLIDKRTKKRTALKGNAAAQTLFVFSPSNKIPSRLLHRIQRLGTCQIVLGGDDCPDCGGTGNNVDEACGLCDGTGIIEDLDE